MGKWVVELNYIWMQKMLLLTFHYACIYYKYQVYIMKNLCMNLKKIVSTKRAVSST